MKKKSSHSSAYKQKDVDKTIKDLKARKVAPSIVLQKMIDENIPWNMYSKKLADYVLDCQRQGGWTSKLDITKLVQKLIKDQQYDVANSYMSSMYTYRDSVIVDVDNILYEEIKKPNSSQYIVNFLKGKGANVNNAFVIALENAHNNDDLNNQIARYREYLNADMVKNAFFTAVRTGKSKIVKDLLSLKKINTKDVNKIKDDSLQQALYDVSDRGHKEVARLLIENGVAVDCVNHERQTPLNVALSRQNYEVAKILIEHGADINKLDEYTLRTALHDVSANGHKEVAMWLIENGVAVDCVNRNGQTPLHVALSRQNYEVAKILIEHGADINKLDHMGKEPLSYVISSEDIISDMREASQTFLLLCELYQNHEPPLEGTPYSQKMAVHRKCYKQFVNESENASIKFIFEHTIDSITWEPEEVKKVLDFSYGKLQKATEGLNCSQKLSQFLGFLEHITNDTENPNLRKVLESEDLKVYIMELVGGDLDLNAVKIGLTNQLIAPADTRLDYGGGEGETKDSTGKDYLEDITCDNRKLSGADDNIPDLSDF